MQQTDSLARSQRNKKYEYAEHVTELVSKIRALRECCLEHHAQGKVKKLIAYISRCKKLPHKVASLYAEQLIAGNVKV